MKDWDELYTIGNATYVQNVTKTCDQVIRTLDITHTEEEWNKIVSLNQIELMNVINTTMRSKKWELYTFYPC